ncbi:MAG: hypothetical protein ACE10C_15330, partial [Candidatus Binatia bacterium]
MQQNPYRRMLLVFLAWMLFPLTGLAQQVPSELVVYPNLIVHNAKIVTMDDYDINTNLGSTFQAVAVRDKRIFKLGTNQ